MVGGGTQYNKIVIIIMAAHTYIPCLCVMLAVNLLNSVTTLKSKYCDCFILHCGKTGAES